MVNRNHCPEPQTAALRRRLFLAQAGMLGAWAATPAQAQFRVEVNDLGAAQLPIAVAAFSVRGVSVPNDVAAIVRADLDRSGLFRLVDPGQAPVMGLAPPDFAAWRKRGADFVVVGHMEVSANGRLAIEARLWDVVRGGVEPLATVKKSPWLDGRETARQFSEIRLAAHEIADDFYAKLIGERGVFATRIAFVNKQGPNFALVVADSDGDNQQIALRSAQPIISPAWSPDGQALAFVSYHVEGRPIIYTHEVYRAGAQPRAVASFRGSNSAPAWTRSGPQQIIAALSLDGGSQIYAIDPRGGSEPRRLTQSGSIDTEPYCAPGRPIIYFVSDRRGRSPQIYRMDFEGKAVELVTRAGAYNISPAISPDGKWMAYISLVGSAYRLHLMDLSTGESRPLTDTTADESPSFAPNGKLILYETRLRGREVLMTSTLDGRIRRELAVRGEDIREPDWGPYQTT
jgi:TolB protein